MGSGSIGGRPAQHGNGKIVAAVSRPEHPSENESTGRMPASQHKPPTGKAGSDPAINMRDQPELSRSCGSQGQRKAGKGHEFSIPLVQGEQAASAGNDRFKS
mmetsp:Transcript_117407/g.365630  ORF Transcript_117407/g.365630 Transcript_117407/m.365630 type:complete len:102 (+) Transcript_117407:163-468(+)